MIKPHQNFCVFQNYFNSNILLTTHYQNSFTKTVSKRSKFWSLLQCCVKNGFHVNPVQVTITKKKSEPLGPAYKIVGLAHFLINQPNSAMPQSFYSCNLSFFFVIFTIYYSNNVIFSIFEENKLPTLQIVGQETVNQLIFKDYFTTSY